MMMSSIARMATLKVRMCFISSVLHRNFVLGGNFEGTGEAVEMDCFPSFSEINVHQKNDSPHGQAIKWAAQAFVGCSRLPVHLIHL